MALVGSSTVAEKAGARVAHRTIPLLLRGMTRVVVTGPTAPPIPAATGPFLVNKAHRPPHWQSINGREECLRIRVT